MCIQRKLRIKWVKHSLVMLILFTLSFSKNEANAQFKFNVLFLGNSYTEVNNLPQIIQNVSNSTGDTLIYDKNAPGGFRLSDHHSSITSKNKIKIGNWDYVVIQGQSQEPIINTSQFNSGASALANLIKQSSPCAVIMPYMTWGRKNGDQFNCASFPEMCSYQGMDTTLRNKYLNISKSIKGEVSPVSIVWNYLRNNFPNIELYDPDESHPSTAGSYAAACCFYTSIFKKDPTFITYNFGLNANDAAIIRNAVKETVFNKLQQWDYKKLSPANFSFQVGDSINEINFYPKNISASEKYLWNFGDGNTSNNTYTSHSYLNSGNYLVSLTISNCDLQGSHSNTVDTIVQICNHTPTIYNNKSWLCDHDTLWTQNADSYQWYYNGSPLPETNQYLPNYFRYAKTGFSVNSTVNGCSEMSQVYSKSTEWSGYYFDLIGNPCQGDTVAFALLHINGFLNGFENIYWYKNDTLIPSLTNQDTLLIYGSGKYECKVTNPVSNCPLDTTSYSIKYNCEAVGIVNNSRPFIFSCYPNPAKDFITFNFSNYSLPETVEIFNTMGSLIKSVVITKPNLKIMIDDLSNGVYYTKLKKHQQYSTKFIVLKE